MPGEKPPPIEAAPTAFGINPGGRIGPAEPAVSAPPGSTPVRPAPRAARPMALTALQVPNSLGDVLPFLVLAARFRLGVAGEDPVRLLRSVQGEIVRVFDLLPQRGWDGREVQLAKFFVCCAIDNAALNSPLASTWSGNQLTSTFFSSASGGAKFFANVAAMLASAPAARPPLRLFELAHLCLVCGFEGRYGLGDPARESEIEQLKRRLLAVIAEQGRLTTASFLGTGIPQREPLASRSWRLPVWPLAALVAALCVVLLFAWRGLLGHDVGAVLAKLDEGAQLPLPALVAPVVKSPQAEWIERLRKLTDSAGFTLTQDGDGVTVTGSGGLFASASDQVRDEWVVVYQQIGELLDEVRGGVIVRGHTDQQPIRSLRFQNNTELSRARAKAVGRILQGRLKDKSRVYIMALGEREPVCTEMTAQCLDRNRRVQIVLDPNR